MSQINEHEGEISLNERNSITGSSGLHNLTGTRTRFQPVRIKALLSLFESEDDDTEPRDSDDNSDTESLQALPDDEEDYNNPGNSSKDEDRPPEKKTTSKTHENVIGISMIKPHSVSDQIFNKFEANELYEKKQTDHQISSNSNNFDLKNSNPLSSSIKKTSFTVPLKHHSNDVDNAGKQVTIFTPQASIDLVKKKVYNQSNAFSDIKFEGRQDNLIDVDSQSKTKEPLYNTAMETPLKRETVLTSNQISGKEHRNIQETPRIKLNKEYHQGIEETPGLIFSHWSRNKFFETPTHNPIIFSNKEGQSSHSMHDIKLQPHRYCTSENRIVRRPLSEAMHLNHGSSINDNAVNNHVAEHQSFVKSNLLTKENCPIESNRGVKANVAYKMTQSLQENNRQRDNNQKSLSAFLMKDQISNCQTSLEIGKATPSMCKEKKDHESIQSKAGISDKNLIRDVCEKRQTLQQNFEGILNSKNDTFGMESRETRAGSIFPSTNGQESNLPLPVKCETNPGNVQFSVAAKTADKKYGKMINVKGTDYIVLGKLGQGMSGEVLRVQEVKTGELRAIKCVDLSCIEKETAQGCLEEVSMLDRLRAPCIITMFTYEIKSNLLYVVMEMGDTDLSKLLRSMSREKQLPLTMILYYWTEMLTAVNHIHDNGVIHSDLKPANFLLVRGRLKLIDFGIASTVNADMTSVVKNTSLGTLNYISPEAINDIGGNGDSPSDNNQYKINFKSDVWSLGCILYSLVYGQTPFQHIRANWAKVNAITNPNHKIAFPPADSTNRRGYTSPPPFLIDVMRRCLQHDRKARPTVSQLLQIPYVGCNCPPASSLPSIPPSILSKIKHSLEENEWRQLLEALERRKPLQ